MIDLSGYSITEHLYSGSRTLVYRGIRTSDQFPVVIKLLKRDYPSFSELVQFRNQYTITKNLNFPGIVQSYSLEPYQNSYALVMEDCGGISLSQYARRQQDKETPAEGAKARYSWPIAQFLAIALQLTDILNELYCHQVIHKDFKPANILINPESEQIKLIDFSIASLLSKETQEIQSPNVLQGTLAYLSPEQTGRMNRGVDYRSDFYSLGVTFYELLTGQLPFQSHDLMELIHCHIAKQPTAVHSVNPEIPVVLSAVVSKLMAKNAEDRYQSALGLKYDLENCLIQWQETGRIDQFELGQRDVCDRFVIPEKLYGRQKEVQDLLDSFERVRQGSTEIVLVAGFSGIGKTAVVNEVHKPIARGSCLANVRQRGYFIKGKFDQFQRDIPFSAFVQAFRDLMRQLLSENDAQLAQWKNKILAALGDIAQLIIEVIPELERIIGKQAPAPELSGSAAQNRFNLLFQKFIQVFTAPEHPLVIFIDDLQWGDAASLKLMQLLMSEVDSYLLFIGAYRDNEVTPAHPLMLTLEEIQKAEAIVNTIMLAPLNQQSVNQLVADTLSCSLELALPLTELVIGQTNGNPFFTTQFLKALYDDGQITFNFARGEWQYNVAQVRSLSLTDDVVELMATQLQKLPLAAQQVLKLAACVGNQFDLATLAIVHEKSQAETAIDLWEAIRDGLIIPTNEVYKFYQQSNQLESYRAESYPLENYQAESYQAESAHIQLSSYRFLHDRVQQAAYSLIPDHQKQSTHYQIGQLLLQQILPAARVDRIFELVNQLNYGTNLIAQQTERDELAQLNLKASLKAKSSTAYTAAQEYLKTSIKLVGDQGWHRTYELTLKLHRELAEIEFLCGNFEQTESLVAQVITYAEDVLDQAEICNLLVVQYTLLGQYTKAIETGLNALKLLGIDLIQTDLKTAIRQEINKINAYLADHSVLSLLEDLSETRDRRIRIAVQLLVNIDPPVYITSQIDLYTLVSAKIVAFSIQYGYIPETVKGYGNYGWLSGLMFGDYQTGYDFGVLGMELARKISNRAQLSKVCLSFGSWIHGWSRPVREVFEVNEEGYHAGLESGEVLFGGYNLFCKVSNLLFGGVSLDDIYDNLQKYLPFANKTKNGLLSGVLGGIYFLVESLRDEINLDSKNSASTPNITLDKDAYLKLCQDSQDFCSLSVFYIWQMQLACINQTFSQGLTYAIAAQKTLKGALGFLPSSEYPIYASLILLNLYAEAMPEQQIDYLQQVQKYQAQYKVWVDNCPENFLHKYLLVEAERHRIMGNVLDAMDCYDRAIAAANSSMFIHIGALANELAAKFYLERNKERIAQEYMTEAYYGYVRWGAKAKLADLERRYPQLLAPILQQTRLSFSVNETVFATGTLSSISSSSSVSDSLDLAVVLKASQSLSSEIELDKLLATLLHTVIQTAGADKCVLLLVEETDLIVRAIAALTTSDQIETTVPKNPQPVHESHEVPVSLLNTVKRNLQPVVINTAVTHPEFATNVYIQTRQPKSLLCSPILHQGKLLGIVYLENNLATDVFTRDRVELLNLLCAQAAISLENARLYERSQQYAQRLEQKTQALETALSELQNAQLKIVQSEKMSALGNLVAGVAHEINNPVGFIAGNLQPAIDYINDTFGLIDLYQQEYPNPSAVIQEEIEAIDLAYVRKDLPKLISSMKEGTDRIRDISISLRTFSRADKDYKVPFNLHEGIDSSLMILKHRLKANENRPEIEIVKSYGKLPLVECFAGQLNQVFMNLLANAIDALEESNQNRMLAEIQANSNLIKIQTELADENQVVIQIADNGIGMSEAVKQQIFDHLFTTKPVGQGTGLGLAIAHQIVVDKHQGAIEVNSSLGEGTEFSIMLPVKAANLI